MAQNHFHTLTQANLVNVGTQFNTAIVATPANYGLSALQAASFTPLLTAYNTAISNYNAAKAAQAAAMQAKVSARAALTALLADFAKVAYAYPGITNEHLADAGLAIYKTPGTVTPQTPTQLLAEPYATGDVDLSWNRNGNPYGVTFAIETKGEAGAWTMVTATDAARHTLTGFTPGVAAWFRVVAINNGVTSTPSLEVSVYHDGGGQQVQLQAA